MLISRMEKSTEVYRRNHNVHKIIFYVFLLNNFKDEKDILIFWSAYLYYIQANAA